jgi:hypothetical protein
MAMPLASATAQRGGTRPTADEGQSQGRPQRPATVGQFEDLNPARMLVDKRKKLALTDSQVLRMKAVEKLVKERNAPLLAEYDSVRREILVSFSGPAGGEMGSSMGFGGGRGGRRSGSGGGSGAGIGGGQTQSPEAAAKMAALRQSLGTIGRTLRERRATDIAESLALLTPDQLTGAREFITEQDQEFDRIAPRGGRGG